MTDDPKERALREKAKQQALLADRLSAMSEIDHDSEQDIVQALREDDPTETPE